MRQETGRQAGDEQFQSWFFETAPAQAGMQNDPDTHAFLAFEVACGLFDRDRTADGFLLLGWLGRHFVRGPDADSAARAIMALTDTCVARAIDKETSAHAIRVLRGAIDSAWAPIDIPVEHALCRALSVLANLSSRHITLDRRKGRELAQLWRELAKRCRGRADPVLRGWRAHALGNEALLRLQSGREVPARRRFAAIIAEFGADPRGANPDVDLWVSRARHAPGMLERFDVGAPGLKLDYLKRQRHWDRRRRFKGLGLVHWLLAGAPRNHMRSLARRARNLHRLSAGTVRSWLCCGEPFVLLLRNFELTERSGITRHPSFGMELPPEEFTGDHIQVISFTDGGNVLGELAGAVPLITVASTSAATLEIAPSMGQFLPPVRLYLPEKTWLKTVSMLISLADQVIIWAAEFTPGLAEELEFLAAERRTDETLVVLESEVSPAAVRAVLPRARSKAITKDHPDLAAFPHVIDAAELKGRHLAESPPLLRVIQRLSTIRQVPIDQRLAELSARMVIWAEATER